MYKILACCERFLAIFRKKNNLAHKRLSKKFQQLESSVSEISMPSLVDSPDNIPLNNFNAEQDTFVFIKPNIDEETASHTNKNNLSIHNCRRCSFYILNGLQNAYIDECEDTFIFVGPCTSTLFIRHCKNVKVRAISQQLRIQNSENIKVQGIVGVRPVLEGSKNITFCSLDIRIYDDLLWQIERAKINVFDNQIFECYDFTPKKPPNFQNESITEDMDENWQTFLEERQLVWDGKNIHLPNRMPIKASMIKKLFTPAYLESNGDLGILYTPLHQKQLINFLGGRDDHVKYQIVCELDRNICENILKGGVEMKKIQEYRFLFVKVLKEEGLMGNLVRECKIINQILNKM